MIAFLRGRLEDKGLLSVDIDVGGVGYRAFMSTNSLAAMPPRGEPVFIYTYTYVREDTLQLFGFTSVAEREAFEKLITVSGIGPKVALAVLSAFDVESLKAAIAGEDIARITSVPGIGKKSAQRLVLELKDKIGAPDLAIGIERPQPPASVYEEARSALLALGYSVAEARKALENFKPDGEAPTVEALVKHGLKNLMRT